MDKKFTLESRLKKYTALAGGLTAAVVGTGQIYTDINPDAVLSADGDSLNIDFNGDMIVDLTLSMINQSISGTFSYGSQIVSYGVSFNYANVSAGNGANSGWMASNSSPVNVAAGAAIGGAGSFSNGSGVLGSNVYVTYGAPFSAYNTTYASGGNFLGSTDGYIGVKFDASGAAHYGWVRVELSADSETLTVKDYAFQPIPGEDIIAGDMGTVGISELNNFASIVSTNNNVVISLLNGTNSADATITSVSGQQVFSQFINADREVIELKDFASGIYMVNVRSEKGIVSKKVYVK